jgi:hypothetical protein
MPLVGNSVMAAGTSIAAEGGKSETRAIVVS